MEMPVQILWIIAEDDEEELDMYEVFMFNKVASEDNHVTAMGMDQLPGWHPPAAGNRPSLLIALDMHEYLTENNTSTIETLIRGKTLTPYMNGMIDYIMPIVGDGKSAWLDFTLFVAGFNVNEWVLFKP